MSLVLFLVALILSVISLLQSRGQGLTNWAVLCVALGLTWGRFPL